MSKLTHTPKHSSNVKHLEYDDAARTLRVTFHNGGIYEYTGVPAETFAGLRGAESVGKHLNQHVIAAINEKGEKRFPSTRINPVKK